LRFLLDTHIWIWLLQSPERLGSRTQQELRNTANELWVSPISTWEALMLHRKTRNRLRDSRRHHSRMKLCLPQND
jgi:PIN domain nuclease of toxin-antitoxin system